MAQSAEPGSGAAAAAVGPDGGVRSRPGSSEAARPPAAARRGETELGPAGSHRPGQEVSRFEQVMTRPWKAAEDDL